MGSWKINDYFRNRTAQVTATVILSRRAIKLIKRLPQPVLHQFSFYINLFNKSTEWVWRDTPLKQIHNRQCCILDSQSWECCSEHSLIRRIKLSSSFITITSLVVVYQWWVCRVCILNIQNPLKMLVTQVCSVDNYLFLKHAYLDCFVCNR